MRIKISASLIGGLMCIVTGCASVDASNAEAANTKAGKSVRAFALSESADLVPCPSPSEILGLTPDAYFGIYSQGDTFWFGTEHGTRVQSPRTPFIVPVAPGTPYLIRWAINDTATGSRGPVSVSYKFDDTGNETGWAYNAMAINTCTQESGGMVCQQPLFGQQAWEEDDTEFCPPVISADGSFVFLYDRNDNQQEYEYSVALVVKGNGPKAGLRVILDPRIVNGGGIGNR